MTRILWVALFCCFPNLVSKNKFMFWILRFQFSGLTKIRTRRRSRRQQGKAGQRRTGLKLIHYI
ncbi:hypothetical protein E4W18_09730 [Neisseria meningitidis]|nr:hypothetical protein [Neisseria meningitidis]